MPKGKAGKPPEDRPLTSSYRVPRVIIDDDPPVKARGNPGKPSEQSPQIVAPASILDSATPLNRRLVFRGIHQDILNDTTEELAVEGARDCGKSYLLVTKEIRQLKEHPGMFTFIFRFSDTDTQQKLVPFFREMCGLEEEFPEWNTQENSFRFKNGSIAFMFGLRGTTSSQRYSKMRGLGVSRCYCDQSEELPEDLSLELRAALRQPGYAHQLTFGANPPGHKHWMVDQFPLDNRLKGRKLYQLSIYTNKHNLPAESIARLERAFPPEHPKHKPIILGMRGPNVTGTPIYRDLFTRSIHVRPVRYDPKLPLWEGFDFGKLNPCWMVCQRPYSGGLHWIGGILSDELFLTDFLPIVMRYRGEWFPQLKSDQVRSCCTLSVSRDVGSLTMGVRELRPYGIRPIWTEGSNSPDMVLAMIERQAAYMRRRGADSIEMLAVNDDESHWLKVSREGIDSSPFMAEAYGGGYTWAEKDDGKPKTVSVGRNEFRQPQNDDWFEYPMRIAEHIELNFARGLTQAEIDADAARATKLPLAAKSKSVWT